MEQQHKRDGDSTQPVERWLVLAKRRFGRGGVHRVGATTVDLNGR